MKSKVRKCCDTCELNNGMVCTKYGKRSCFGDYTYGIPIDETKKMFPDGCEEWEISVREYLAVYSL